jgi:hypothetical protein
MAFVAGAAGTVAAPQAVPVARPAYPVAAPANPGVVAGAPVAASAVAVARPAYAAAVPMTPGVPVAMPASAPAPGSRRGLTLGLIIGGSALFLILGIVLAFICFRSGPAPRTDDDGLAEGDDPQAVPVAVKKKAPTPLIVLTKEEQKKVDAAIARGVEYLKKTQLPNGTWPGGNHPVGYAAMGGLTLLECGVKANEPPIQKAAQFVRDALPRLNGTYELSLAILFLDRLGDKQDKQRIQQMALRLVAGQTQSGGWSYTCPLLNDDDSSRLAALLKDLDTHGRNAVEQRTGNLNNLPVSLRRLAALQNPEQKPPNFYRTWGDNSNTQFAILALWAARRHDVPLDKTLELVVLRFKNTQNADGSWNYTNTQNVNRFPTMTCAGLLGRAVEHGLSKNPPKVRPDQDPDIQRALQHLSQHVGQPVKDGTPVGPLADLYYLWSVERVAMLYQLKKIGDKQWYHWGMQLLLTHQRPDGHWQAGGHGASPLVDTCFALLFLHRVNLAKDLTEKLEEIGGARPQLNAVPPPRPKG